MKSALLTLLMTLSIMVAAASTALAHPHMFFKSTAQFILDDQGRLSQLRVVFLIDELNTLYTLAELGVNQDGDQTLSDEETNKIVSNVLEGFGHYKFFTHLYEQDRPVELAKPSNIAVQLHQQRLGLVFTLPLQTPRALKNNSLSLQLYDPTFFTHITIDLPPTIVGSGASCTVAVSQPASTQETRRSQRLLSQLSREEKPDIENVGVTFAETTRLACKG